MTVRWDALTLPAHISDAQRNVILQHASSRVYEQNYLPRYITQDTQAAYRGLAPQVALTRLASGMSRTIDTRQPRHLNPEQADQLNRHPEVRLMMRTRDAIRKRVRSDHGSFALARGSELAESYHKARRDYQKTRKAVGRAILRQVQRDYRKQQALADIAKQLRERSPQTGMSASPGPNAGSSDESDQLSDERLAVLLALFSEPKQDDSDECQRRSSAVNAVIKLCECQEPSKPYVRRSERHCQPTNQHNFSDSKGSPYPIRCSPTQCIFCLGNVALEPKTRQRSFRDVYTLRTHFTLVHLNLLPDDEAIECPHPKCDQTLRHKQHLQNHALHVHNTRT